jgi:acetolactate synthase I/II/III large subunit
MIRLADYVAKTLAENGVRHIFMVTGGGAMHLNDAFGREKRIKFICNHHEQACAMAAEGYARVTNRLGVINVTTGPGGINALNGVFGAWTDSIPMLVISGQVKKETCMAACNLRHLRQLGDQEADIIPMVKGITKYAVMVTDPAAIRYHLERAIYLATTGRPGPCWIDIPLDVQGSPIEEASLAAYDPAEDRPPWDLDNLPTLCAEVLGRILRAERPVILVGTGVRLAGATPLFDKVIRKLGVPVATGWTAHDIMASDDPLYCGRPGTIGDRAGNFAVQNSDLLLVLGSRLNIRQISYNWKSFARHAFKIQVDADQSELDKPTISLDLPIFCDARLFLEELDRQIDQANYSEQRHAPWVAWCRERVNRYPVVLPRHRVFNEAINPYHFVEELFKRLSPDDVIVCGNGSACVIPFQAGPIKKGQRMFANSGCASMGYDLPAAIGAAIAREGKRVICLAGDGSILMNIQELQTVAHQGLPIKLFILNNRGYLSICQTQESFFNGNLVGSTPESGVTFPDFVRVAEAFGLPAMRLGSQDFVENLDEILSRPEALVCEVVLDPKQGFEPKLSSKPLPDGRIVSPPLEDMYPFLDREELIKNLFIPPLDF